MPFFGTHTDSTLFRYSQRFDPFRYSPGQLFDTRTDFTFFWYSPGFYYCSVLTQIRPFFGTRRDSFLILVPILPFPITRPGFYHFSVLTQIRPFFGTRRDSFSILVPILPFPGTRPDSTILRYSHRFDPFSILAGTVF